MSRVDFYEAAHVRSCRSDECGFCEGIAEDRAAGADGDSFGWAADDAAEAAVYGGQRWMP